MIFFFVFFFQMLVSGLYSLGIGGMGSSGLILGFHAVGSESGGVIFVGVVMIIIGIGFGLAGLADFYMLVRVCLKVLTIDKSRWCKDKARVTKML